MKKLMSASLISLVFATNLIGCSSPKDATKDNFAKVIIEKMAKEPYYYPTNGYNGNYGRGNCLIQLGKMPQEITSNEEGDYYAALQKAGLLTGKLISSQEFQEYRWSPKKIITVTKYDLSEKGKQLAQEKEGDYTLPFCQIKFKEIKLFTEPSAMQGMTVSEVKFTFVVEKVDDWAKQPELREYVPYVQRVLNDVGKVQDFTSVLVLTNEGWSADTH